MSNPDSHNNVVPFIRPNYYDRDKSPDLGVYEAHLVKFGMTPAEREEFLKALWTLICGFIDLGYGQHPTQHPNIADVIYATDLLETATQSKQAA